MKRFLSLILLPLLGISACKGQPAGKTVDAKSLLWKVSGKGLTKSSYLFGTIHMICPSDYFWTNAMQRSLAACKRVCLEMDMDDQAVTSEAQAGMMNPPGKTLKDYFTPAQYERLDHYMKDSVGLGMEMLQGMKPIAVESVLLMKIMGCGIPVSYEANLMDKAHKAKQDVIGLETAKEQLDVLSSMPDDSTIASLMQITDSMEVMRQQWTSMVKAYKQQDLPALYDQIKESKDLGGEMGPLLNDRNKRWIPKIEKLIKDQPTFFAVGAGHLWGQEGVITLLRKAGYTVEPVR